MSEFELVIMPQKMVVSENALVEVIVDGENICTFVNAIDNGIRYIVPRLNEGIQQTFNNRYVEERSLNIDGIELTMEAGLNNESSPWQKLKVTTVPEFKKPKGHLPNMHQTGQFLNGLAQVSGTIMKLSSGSGKSRTKRRRNSRKKYYVK